MLDDSFRRVQIMPTTSQNWAMLLLHQGSLDLYSFPDIFQKLAEDFSLPIFISRQKTVYICCRFDKMGQNSRKDLAAVKNAYKHGDPVPRFHYETRTFTLVQ